MPASHGVARIVTTRPAGNGFVPAARTVTASSDTSAAGRARAAADAVTSLYAAMIDAVHKDTSLTPGQKAAAIRALKQRQKVDSRAARHRVMDEEKSRLEAARRAEREVFDRHPNPAL